MFFLHCLMEQGLGMGSQTSLSEFSDMQYLHKQTHKLTRHLHADMELCMHVTQPHTHAVTNWQMGTQTQTNKQTMALVF